MFENSPYVILYDAMLEGLVGEGCSRSEYGIGWWNNGASHVIIVCLKKVGFKGSLRFDI